MMRVWRGLFLVVFFLGCAGSAGAGASDGLLARAMALNSGLRSYQAKLSATLQLQTFPFLSFTLVGMRYHKRPNLDKIVFSSGLPALGAQFDKVYPKIPSPSSWPRLYLVSKGGDNGRTTTYTLVPRKRGRVAHVTVRIDDADATIASMRWSYVDGGYVKIDQRFERIDGNYLVAGQTGELDVPAYKATLTSTFRDYRLNPSLQDGFFKGA
ncbi:MAG: hypothetical protein ACYDGW_00620 [Vulcanimicrobiaceae bacterium]